MDLATARLATYSDLASGRIAISGPRLTLNSTAAQSIGMALHLLATNATKYGALSNDRGSVDVSWMMVRGKLLCTCSERDGPPVVVPSRRGFFGTTVIDQIVCTSVNGTVTLDYTVSGLTWRLECPLEALAVAVDSDHEYTSSYQPQGFIRASVPGARLHLA